MPAWRLLVVLVLATGCVDLSLPEPTSQDGPTETDSRLPVDAAGDRGDDSPVDAPSDQLPEDPDALTNGGDGPDAPAPDGAPDLPPVPPDLAPDLPLITNGNPCGQPTQCASGFCAAGVCCDSACTGLCRSCTVAGKLGTCSPVPAGEDPDSDCPRDPPNTCAFDGTCDGAGSCRRYPANTECAPGGCTVATETAASLCNGGGTCVAGTTRACSPNVCMGASCGATCSADSQCQTGFYCAAGKCTVKRTQGMTCGSSNECGTGFCADGVCCASQCGQLCFACNVAGQLGTCVAAPAGEDPRMQCPMQAAATCGRLGGCNGSGACRLHPAGTPCAAGSCSGSTETAAAMCNGLGTCAPPTTRPCDPYICGAGACATTCTSSAQCAPGVACTSGVCSVLPGLILHWRFEEAAGTSAADSSGAGHNGVYMGDNGTPTPSTNLPALRYTNARSRDFVLANRQAVRLPNFPAALKPTSNFTIGVWYRATLSSLDGDGSEMVSGGNAYTLRVGRSQLEMSKATSAGFTDCRATVAGYLDGGWHHLAGVFTTTSMTIYVDGVARMACPNTANVSYTNAGPDFWVGRHGKGELVYDFGGGIDEVRVYNRALTPAEIAVLAGGGS